MAPGGPEWLISSGGANLDRCPAANDDPLSLAGEWDRWVGIVDDLITFDPVTSRQRRKFWPVAPNEGDVALTGDDPVGAAVPDPLAGVSNATYVSGHGVSKIGTGFVFTNEESGLVGGRTPF